MRRANRSSRNRRRGGECEWRRPAGEAQPASKQLGMRGAGIPSEMIIITGQGNEAPGGQLPAGDAAALKSAFDQIGVTYDPRGADRSIKTDPTTPSTPEVHADDLHRLLSAIDAGPVDLFVALARERPVVLTMEDWHLADEVLELCARVCEVCAAECEKHDHEHCKLCAQICRECAADCRHAALAVFEPV